MRKLQMKRVVINIFDTNEAVPKDFVPPGVTVNYHEVLVLDGTQTDEDHHENNAPAHTTLSVRGEQSAFRRLLIFHLWHM